MKSINLKRQEYKYFINNADIYKLKALIASVMNVDDYANVESNGYTITSLYFETPDERDLDEKLDGLLVREKHRIRIYNHNHSHIKLETKKRNGTVISKDSIQISKNIANKLISGDYALNAGDDELLKTIKIKLQSSAYRSKVIVEYDREAYCLPYGNIRITFDKNLRTYNTEHELFNLKHIEPSPVFFDNSQIIEVKFNIELPQYLNDILQTVPATRSSISKYVLSQRFANHDPWKDYLLPSF